MYICRVHFPHLIAHVCASFIKITLLKKPNLKLTLQVAILYLRNDSFLLKVTLTSANCYDELLTMQIVTDFINQ